MLFPALCAEQTMCFLVKLIVPWVRQVASHLVIKNELDGFVEVYRVNEMERP